MKPKFKVGDKVVVKKSTTVKYITDVCNKFNSNPQFISSILNYIRNTILTIIKLEDENYNELLNIQVRDDNDTNYIIWSNKSFFRKAIKKDFEKYNTTN
jgi:hypothetical protein